MALDMAALKSKLSSFKRSGGDRDVALWKPVEGKAVIRIVPFDKVSSYHYHSSSQR